jgi:hypothetical protein
MEEAGQRFGFWLVFFEIPYFEVKDVDPLEDHGVQCW